MCLRNDIEDVRKLQKHFEKVNYIICYKYLRPMIYNNRYNPDSFDILNRIEYYANDNAKIPHHFKSPFYHKIYHDGWNYSNSRRENVCLRNTLINNGIHVRLTKNRKWNDIANFGGCVLVQCRCYAEDLIGAGNFEAVFKKIWVALPPHEIQKTKRRKR